MKNFLVKSKLSTAKKSKTTTFSQVFHPKNVGNFLGKSKVNFWTKNEDFEQCVFGTLMLITHIKLFACSSSKRTDSRAIKRMRSGMSYLSSYLSFIFLRSSSFSFSVLIGGGLGKGVRFSANLSSSFLRACNRGAPF